MAETGIVRFFCHSHVSGSGYVEHLAQVGRKVAVVGHGFARESDSRSDGLPVAFDRFKDDIQGCMPHIVVEVAIRN